MKWIAYLIFLLIFIWLLFQKSHTRVDRIFGIIFLLLGIGCFILYEQGILGVGLPSILLYIFGKVGWIP